MESGCNDVAPKNTNKNGSLRTRLQEYISAISIPDVPALSQMKTLFRLLDFEYSTISAEEMGFARRTLWMVTEIRLTECKRETLPSSFGRIFSNLKILSLSNNGFSFFPESLLGCTALEKLDLSRNGMLQLSDRLGDLVSLVYLDISQNKLKFLPISLSALTALTRLNTQGNNLHTLHLDPDRRKRDNLLEQYRQRMEVQDKSEWAEIVCPVRNTAIFYNKRTGHATNTRPRFSVIHDNDTDDLTNIPSPSDGSEWEIRCINEDGHVHCYNHFRRISTNKFPECLDQIGKLPLILMNLCDNKLKSLPQSLTRMTRLEVLEASRNEIANIELLSASLRYLRRLNLSHNRLKKVPYDLARTIQHLDLSHNNLEVFPLVILDLESLQLLNLNSNFIESVPYELGFLKSLNEVDLRVNPIVDPPYAEMVMSTEKVLWICRQMYKTRQKEGNNKMVEHFSGICSGRHVLSPDFDNKVLQMIDEAITSDQRLDLQFMNLNQIPSRVFQASGIKRIDLSHNPLLHFPECGTVPVNYIVSLVLKSCEIVEINASLQNLNCLENLDLQKNKIATIPHELTSLSELKFLDLSQNQIRHIPSSIGNLKQLTKLNLDNNELQHLHEGLDKCQNLEFFSATDNQLVIIDSFMGNISSLRELRFCRNLIKIVSEDIGKLVLFELSLSFNKIGALPDSCFCPRLCSTLGVLDLNGNNMRSLPHSFGKLTKLKTMNLDMNPLESPPMPLLNEGVESIIKYCAARSKMIQKLVKKLTALGFGIETASLRPPSSNVITEGRGFLTTGDLQEFDEIIHQSINGLFFYNRQSVDDLVQHIGDLRDAREKQCHKKIIDALLDRLQINVDKRKNFRSDIKHVFSVLEGKIECFAVPLDEVLLPRCRTAAAGCSHNLFGLLKLDLAQLDRIYHFQNDDFLRALLDFKSPFGSVAVIEKIKYEGIAEECEKESIVIRQIIYSDEEATRKQHEDEVLKSYYEEMSGHITSWISEKLGIRSINKEVSRRLRSSIRKMNDAKLALRKHRSKSIQKMKAMQKTFTNEEDLRTQKKRSETRIQELDDEYKDARTTNETMTKSKVRECCVEDMKKKYCHFIYEKVVRNGRAVALSKTLRRPWDSCFNEYKEKCLNCQDSNIVLSEIDLLDQLQKLVSSTQYSWENMQMMSDYDNEPYERFCQSSLLNSAIRRLKKTNGETVTRNLKNE